MPVPQHLKPLLRLHPRGAHDLGEGSNVRLDLQPLALVLDEGHDAGQELAADEILPDRTATLITAWERVYDLHHTVGKTLAQRQAACVAARRLLPDFCVSTIDGIVSRYTGIDVTVTEPNAFMLNQLPPMALCDTPGDLVDGAFVFVLDFAWADATAAGLDRDDVEALAARIQPAHTICLTRFDDFHCDDALSLTNRDLLGA